MSIDLGYNSLLVERTGVKADVPDNKIAKLMYYLKCIRSLLPGFFDEEKYKNCFDCHKYDSISFTERHHIIDLAILFNPQILIEKHIIIVTDNEQLLNGANNEFYKITDKRIGLHVNSEILIGGKTITVMEVMVCTQYWLNNNYFWPIEEDIKYRIEDQRRTKICCYICCACCIICLIIIFIILYAALR